MSLRGGNRNQRQARFAERAQQTSDKLLHLRLVVRQEVMMLDDIIKRHGNVGGSLEGVAHRLESAIEQES